MKLGLLPVRDKKAAIFFHCNVSRFTKVSIVISRNKFFAQCHEFFTVFRIFEYLNDTKNASLEQVKYFVLFKPTIARIL